VNVNSGSSDEIINDSKEDLMKDPDEIHLRVPHVGDPGAAGEKDPSCGGRRPSRVGRRSFERIRRNKQKFFTVYDGLSKWWRWHKQSRNICIFHCL
jgi:hypothetical protein